MDNIQQLIQAKKFVDQMGGQERARNGADELRRDVHVRLAEVARKAKSGNKSASIRDYKAANPAASPKEIAEAHDMTDTQDVRS